ncbi:MAG: CPBP family intramembrane metalloprotease [Myxococcales bacterium]|nr:CPBP family intramembrane metalloprotease [Myxococcales bacterium]
MARALEDEQGVLGKGEIIDVVGPEQLPLRELIGRVAASSVLARRCMVLGLPQFVMGPAAAVLERLSADPLLTPSQLTLLREGVVGDPEPARRLLGLETRAFDDAEITRALADFRPRLPSVRLVPDMAAQRELEGHALPMARLLPFALVAIAAMLLGPRVIESVWPRMAVLEGVLLSAALVLGLRGKTLLAPSRERLLWGLGSWLIMWAGALGVGAALSRWAPALWADVTSLYSWAGSPSFVTAALLLLIVLGEEIVWRGALGLAWVARVGPWPAVAISALAFTVAHLTSGPPLLALAAALAGAAWAALAIRTRSLLAPFVCHLLWDLCLLWLTPLTAAR